MPKITKEKFKTWGNVFDRFTQKNLMKLISQHCFEGLESPMSIGKEANLFSARTRDNGLVAVKIYRLEAADFNRMYDYIKNDPRFAGLRNQRRKVLFTWVQREFRNLMRAREAGVRCPAPLTFKDNVMVMEFIGNGGPAPQLKDKIPYNLERFYSIVAKNMRKLAKAGMVHSDLSSFNILNKDDNPVFIDFSQCTPLENPDSKEYLDRDIRNVCNFFRKSGMEISESELRKSMLE